jgi:hypothetical protein
LVFNSPEYSRFHTGAGQAGRPPNAERDGESRFRRVMSKPAQIENEKRIKRKVVQLDTMAESN